MQDEQLALRDLSISHHTEEEDPTSPIIDLNQLKDPAIEVTTRSIVSNGDLGLKQQPKSTGNHKIMKSAKNLTRRNSNPKNDFSCMTARVNLNKSSASYRELSSAS